MHRPLYRCEGCGGLLPGLVGPRGSSSDPCTGVRGVGICEEEGALVRERSRSGCEGVGSAACAFSQSQAIGTFF